MPDLERIPKPSFRIGPSGWFDKAMQLPVKTPHVIAWHIHWRNQLLHHYQSVLSHFFETPNESWLPHLTICRNPLKPKEWLEQFRPLPCFASSLHLYESLGHSQYLSLWSYPLQPPFEEFEHTADIAFRIWGDNYHDLYVNAFTALAFKCPEMLAYWKEQTVHTMDDIVAALNRVICYTDAAVGCPFKAVSFHGNVEEVDVLLCWEMIVDV